jgi:hypothetical protein
LNAIAEQLPFPLWVLLMLQVGQSAIIFAVLTALGMIFANHIGLGLPFLEGWLTGKPIWEKLPRVAMLAIPAGVIGALVVIALDMTLFASAVQQMVEQAGLPTESLTPPWWQGLLASFYGGIAEEVALRLGIMSFFAWLGHFVSRTPEGRPTPAVLWIANILAAVLFGLGHLPAVVGMGIAITPLLIVRTLLLNGIIGIAAGWLYQTRGLEGAMIAHFSADIILHVLPPLISG